MPPYVYVRHSNSLYARSPQKAARSIVAADKKRRANPCKHSIRYRARQKISVYGQTLVNVGGYGSLLSQGRRGEVIAQSRSPDGALAKSGTVVIPVCPRRSRDL